MSKQRGRPKVYKDELFLQFITKIPTTPEEVKRKIKQKYNITVNWKTILTYLDSLVQRGLIQKQKVSKYHTYHTNNVGIDFKDL